jgi:hypothetical protein
MSPVEGKYRISVYRDGYYASDFYGSDSFDETYSRYKSVTSSYEESRAQLLVFLGVTKIELNKLDPCTGDETVFAHSFIPPS